MPKQNIVMDATLLSSLMSCGRLTDFRFNHLMISAGGKSNSMEAGSIIHAGLETYYKMRIDNISHPISVGHALAAAELYVKGCSQCTNFEASEGITRPTCGHSSEQYPGVMNTPMDNTTSPSRIGWRWVLETLEQYFEYYKSDLWCPLEVEKVLSKVLYEDDNIRILWKGKIDLVMDTMNGIYPVDTKTMKQKRDTNKKNNQFIGYCHLLDKRMIYINKIGFQTSFKPEDKFTRVPLSYTSDALLEWQSETLPYWGYKLIEYSESEYWPPNFTHCENKFGNCVYNDICNADRNMRAEEFRINFLKGKEWNPTNEEV